MAPAALAQPPAKAPKAVAPTPASPLVSDVRCLLTMVALSQTKDGGQAGQRGVYYFAGRLAHTPPATLTALVKSEAPTLGQAAALEAESRRCAPQIISSIQGVQASLGALRPPGSPAPGPAPAQPAPAAPSASAATPAAPTPH